MFGFAGGFVGLLVWGLFCSTWLFRGCVVILGFGWYVGLFCVCFVFVSGLIVVCLRCVCFFMFPCGLYVSCVLCLNLCFWLFLGVLWFTLVSFGSCCLRLGWWVC